jgi:hypothetical protein
MIDTIERLLESASLEDAAEALRANRAAIEASDPDALARLEEALYARVRAQREWSDPARGSRALRYGLDIALERNLVDGDTVTSLLIRAIDLTPEDDALLIEYARESSDSNYRYTDRSLLDVARGVRDPARARTLAATHTIVEYFCLCHYLLPPTNPVYVNAMRTAFAEAAPFGVDEEAWQATRRWFLGAVPFADVPPDLFVRYASDA